MRILAIETATEACSVALFDGSACIAHDHRVLGRGHAEALVPMIAALPDKGRADRILVSLGPGSFTGVRIGIATARALGFAWGAEVLGYPTLSLLAAMAQAEHTEGVTVCMNGGHGEWFVQNFGSDDGIVGDAQSLTPDAVRQMGTHVVIVGNRAKECAALFSDKKIALEWLPNAQHTQSLEEANLTHDLSPIYGRAPDAVPQKVAL
ncbi:tRNA (adenosine(37)-N6)-threonylcarbamoyltransferase complex dimerization subunit type 1 TsaB [Erythrobacter sp. YT30]|uniref:tRNA (adenosine(37)-N6)-threonylcarbamoyltransferase complex dimerization subunit type 1 TsaB n=1 Tax=Erythrobacter sp. YT30 TaxID=1735012 RepID=UPI00076C2337|nr:tRNA (adenosine(37)-N6)-threonylcarbamoyltransferase complex dimerization subunit type 1 TsaB [Erythrobacter sp. YT30]KWV93363.1 tRNA threonylcarbamoyladenosine biosynthesis protein TsaB [Erythrobacter sp. YT30]